MDEMTFQALFEHSSLGIIISNENGVIQKSNPHASKIFGYAHGELVGQMIEDLVPSQIREKHVIYRQNYNKNPHPRGMGSNLNLLAVKKSGEQFPVEISLTFYEVEGLRQIVSFVNDITERKRAESDLIRLTEDLEMKVNDRTKELSDALMELGITNEGLKQEMERRIKVENQIRGMLEKEKELNELKSRFVSMASHEFRTPLGGILSSANLIAKYPNTEDEPKRDKHIQTIKRSVKNLTNILNDFLSLDKFEQGKVTSTPTNFNLILFLEDVVEEFRDAHKREILIQHKSNDVVVFQDKDMLRNVLINLISNAIKYSPDDSKVMICTELDKNKIILEIQDRGMGIPLEDQKHLFERFFRGNNVTNFQGTGLGLNIVKRYLDMMGGHIDFKSVENQGTTFRISLPLEQV